MKTVLRLTLALLLCVALCSILPYSGAFAAGTEGVLTLPSSLQIIDTEAFYGSKSINKVVLPNGVKEIRARAFADSTLTEINLPDSLMTIDDSAFSVPGNITVTANKESWVYNWAKAKGFKMLDDPSPLADFVFQAIDDTGSRITGYQGNGGRVVIPATDADGRIVKEIGSNAFNNCAALTEVLLPSTLEKLGDSAFSNCQNLTSINIPSNTQTVINYYNGCGPFIGCDSLTDVSIEEGMVTIPTQLFRGSGIKEIHIPSSVKSIDADAFFNCRSLENVVFPDGLENIGSGCFYGCTSLKKVDLPVGVRNLGGSMTDNGWASGGYNVFKDCTSLEEVTLPQHLDRAESAFDGCSALRTVHFAEGTIVLPYSIFNNCGLEEITLPETIKRIEGSVFQSCTNLNVVHLNEGLLEIGYGAFSTCTSLAEVLLPSTLEKLYDGAFGNCSNLETINIPSDVQTIIYNYNGIGPFYGCALSNVTIEDGMITIPDHLFNSSRIKEIHIPNSVKNIDAEAFLNCHSLETVVFPDGLENIGSSCFYGCTSLKKVDLPATVRNLGGKMSDNTWSSASQGCVFQNCTALEEVTLPQNLDCNGDAFSGCTALRTVIMPFPSDLSFRSLFGWWDDSYSFSSSNPNVASVYTNSGVVSTYNIGNTTISAARNGVTEAELTVYVKSGYVDSGNAVASGILREGDDWAIRWMITYDESGSGTSGNAQLYIYLEGGNRAAGDLMLISSLEDETLMPWLTNGYGFQKSDFNYISIQGSANNSFIIIPGQFSGYNNVRRVELTYVRQLQSGAFGDCTRLQALVFDNWLTNIGDAVFKNDASLDALLMSTSFGASIEASGDEAFMYSGITSFSSGNSLGRIGASAFQGTPLNSLYLSKSVNTIGESAFRDTNLQLVKLEKSLGNIGANAFAGNPSLTIRCYRNSAAFEYAENEHISYEFIDSYDDHVAFNGGMYKAENTLTNLSFDWSFDLFNRSASSPKKELAIASLVLAADAYEWNLLSSAFASLGFENIEPYNYDGYEDINRIAFGIASKTLDVGGYDTNIIVIACRGSNNLQDWVSNIAQQGQGFRFAANNVRDRLDDYIRDKNIDLRLPTKMLITGHSRGAAVANILGTIIPFEDEDVFVYTYASPNTTTDSSRFNCDHISNIAVFGDPVPGQPPMIGGDNVFGRRLLITPPINNNRFIQAFQAITGGLSTVVLINETEPCISPYSQLGIQTRLHAPAVYLASILEPCGSTEGNYGLDYAINQTATYQATTFTR